MNWKIIPIVAIIGILGILLSAAYVVDETELVVVTRFEEVNRTVSKPGLKFKWPVIENAVYYPKNLQEWDGSPDQMPTADKTYIWVDTFARWKITDPVLFFKTIRYVERAKQRLDEILDPAVRNLITSNRLIEAVRNSNRELDTFEVGLEDMKKDQPTNYEIVVGREQLNKEILAQAVPKMSVFGIELMDVKLKRINYVEEVRESVYGRMIAERKQIAEKFRSEGLGEARKILGEKDRDLQEITSEAYRVAEEIKGKADGEATRLYAAAYGKDPEFYSFVRTLDLYQGGLDKRSTVVLSTDSMLLKYLKGLPEK